VACGPFKAIGSEGRQSEAAERPETRRIGPMKRHAEPVCCALLAWLIIMLLGTVRSEVASVQRGDKAHELLEQIRDLELMQRDVEKCYQAERRTCMGEGLSKQSWRDRAELDNKLTNRVFGHLAGTPEYERFSKEYRKLVQRPDYQRLHAADLFAEYMRLLESARARLTSQWECPRQGRFAKDGWAQPQGGSGRAVQRAPAGFSERTKKTESGRVVPAVRFLVQMP
jgi:hypothetical protein